ncbi:protein of unknown function (DUF4378) [Orobanche gracilis]
MSAKTMSSLTDGKRNLRKPIGCMNGIFQIFDRHHFLTGRRMTSLHHERPIQGEQYQLEPQYATRAATEKAPESHKDKPRISTESSRASYSSSSCSSTFSSLEFNRLAQPETLKYRHTDNPKSPFPKESLSLDLRDVVKDSMYRQARSLSIKALTAKDEKKGTVMRHTDSPRPSQQFQQTKPKTPKTIISEGSPQILTNVHESIKNSKDERMALHRFSCDGRESRDSLKWSIKHKEHPRLSLDSKASCMSFLSRDPHMENENSSHNRTSSAVAKLMGLENFPDNISTDENRTPTTKPCPKEAFLSQFENQAAYAPRVPQKNPDSPSPRFHSANFVRKPNTCSRYPVEPAPWRHQDSSQIPPKMATPSNRAPTNNRNFSFSISDETGKRITELHIQKSGKDLRALKNILEAMQKNREQLEDQTRETAKCTPQRKCRLDEYYDQNSTLSMWKNNRRYLEVPKKTGSSAVITKPITVMDKVRFPISNQQGLLTWDPKYHAKNSEHRQKADLASKNNNLKNPGWHLPSTDKKTSRNKKTSCNKKLENCTARGRSLGMVSPRLQQNLEMQSQSTIPSTDSDRDKKQCSNKLVEKGLQNKKQNVKVKYLQLSDDQLSELSSETRYSSYQIDTVSTTSESNNSPVSKTATEVTSLVYSVNMDASQKENSGSTTGEHMPAVEIVVTMSEQPSPISVLDDTFYSEDSPSPVKKIPIVFLDESQSPSEAEWHLENLNQLTDCTRSKHALKYNQKLENLKNSVQGLTLLTETDAAEVDHNTVIHQSQNPDHRYINKILLTSGLLKDSNFISTIDQLISPSHLINPDMFHVLEQSEEMMEGVNGQVSGKNERAQWNKKIQRKNVFDVVDELLVRKVTSARLTSGNRRASPQGLLKEVYLEMDRLCRIQECNLDNEEDGMIRLLNADMMYQDDWVNYSGEVPALGLDIERLIFKDLINEVVTGDVICVYDWPMRHCRKLFTK